MAQTKLTLVGFVAGKRQSAARLVAEVEGPPATCMDGHGQAVIS